MFVSGTDTHTTKLKPTLDPMQKRFSCGEDELCIWRNSRCYRYSATDNGEISVEINNYDINYAIFPDIPLLTSVPSPSKLSETVIWIFLHSAKSITVTLYFTLGLVALYFGRAKTALTGIQTNVKSSRTMSKPSWKTNTWSSRQPLLVST